ncbi:MAG: penicillin-binding protein 2 [Bacteroidales bacterium]|nr:penicillin-binding protein 2 [Bacteroidales bacterium]
MAQRNLSERKYVVFILMLSVGLIYLVRLFYIQVLDDAYMLSAENNVLREITLYPNRGLIFDRNGKLLVYDEAAYDVMLIPGRMESTDTVSFCSLFGISDTLFRDRLKKAKQYSWYKPSVFVSQISKTEYGFIQDQLHKFPGFFVQSRSLRIYPFPVAAHTLGYIGEVNDQEIKNDPYYKMGDYIGKSGLEKAYEPLLRGKKGKRIVMVDVHNREQGSYRNGKYDSLPEEGARLHLSIDYELQAYAEKLMENKTGSIVAIDPATGGILALVTSPTYDPNLLVGRVRGKNFARLSEDSLKPLLNRAVLGTYPPGSTFKLANALIGMQEQRLFTGTAYSCNGPASSPIRCSHNHYSPLQLKEAIEQSCNPYFWEVFRSVINNPAYPSVKASYDKWREYMLGFGFGRKFNTDIPFEVSGNIPTSEYFDKMYGQKRWNTLTIRSLSIGQGEILLTPLQLANQAAIIANRGFYYPPHIVNFYEVHNKTTRINYERVITPVLPAHFDVVKEAMLEVFEGEHGTARWARLEGVHICGKTGTVQNPHGKDHSLFIAFAPIENPAIAMSVVVENSGFGSTWAAPIASLLVEKYLNDTISRPQVEQRILEGNLNK